MRARVLIVEVDPSHARSLRRALDRAGHEVATAGSAEAARVRFYDFAPEVVILDDPLPDGSSLDLLDELRARVPETVFLYHPASPTLDTAEEAIRRGAEDFLAGDRTTRECVLRVERALDRARLRRGLEARAGHDEPLGDSPAMRRLDGAIEELARESAPVLVIGEPGSGAELVAKALHRRSGRAHAPFLTLDCAALPAALHAGELLGRPAESSRRPRRRRLGLADAAVGGTLFVDRIVSLDLAAQGGLLRLLAAAALGADASGPHSAPRVVASTHGDLDGAVRAGRFEARLRDRLAMRVLEVPPLRERGDDVALLASHFAAQRARALGREQPTLAEPVLRAMRRYPFPGNVRELLGMVEQAVLLGAEDELGLDVFPILARLAGTPPPPALRQADGGSSRSRPPSLEAIRSAHERAERDRVVRALDRAGGNVSATARALGLSRYQVLRRLAKYGLR